jgi:mRNA-degrading endonuclease YafQ of YafQ-DinJ toxin-antitoxin module
MSTGRKPEPRCNRSSTRQSPNASWWRSSSRLKHKKLIFPGPHRKKEKAFLKKHPDLRERYFKTLLLVEQNPMHPSLRLQPLQGRLAGLHCASISMQYRITLELEIREQEIVFVDVGSHGEVY